MTLSSIAPHSPLPNHSYPQTPPPPPLSNSQSDGTKKKKFRHIKSSLGNSRRISLLLLPSVSVPSIHPPTHEEKEPLDKRSPTTKRAHRNFPEEQDRERDRTDAPSIAARHRNKIELRRFTGQPLGWDHFRRSVSTAVFGEKKGK